MAALGRIYTGGGTGSLQLDSGGELVRILSLSSNAPLATLDYIASHDRVYGSLSFIEII